MMWLAGVTIVSLLALGSIYVVDDLVVGEGLDDRRF